MRRREFIALIGASVTWPFTAMAQEPGRTYRIGVLAPFTRDVPFNLALLDELRRRGFTEGQNLTVEWRAYGPHVDLIEEYATELVRTRPDLLYVGGGEAIRVAQHATKAIPILGITDDMVGEGLVDSLARPNGNTTGVSIFATELDGKRQEILIEAVPGLRRMAILADANNTAATKLDALQEAAHARGVELSIYRIAKGEEILGTIDVAKTSGAAALNVLASPMLDANYQLIMDWVAALRLPAMYQWPERAEEGGFAAYGPRFLGLPSLQARQLAQLLRGTKVADIPVEQPTKFELVINLKTAQAMNVTVPEALLARADKVIE